MREKRPVAARARCDGEDGEGCRETRRCDVWLLFARLRKGPLLAARLTVARGGHDPLRWPAVGRCGVQHSHLSLCRTTPLAAGLGVVAGHAVHGRPTRPRYLQLSPGLFGAVWLLAEGVGGPRPAACRGLQAGRGHAGQRRQRLQGRRAVAARLVSPRRLPAGGGGLLRRLLPAPDGLCSPRAAAAAAAAAGRASAERDHAHSGHRGVCPRGCLAAGVGGVGGHAAGLAATEPLRLQRRHQRLRCGRAAREGPADRPRHAPFRASAECRHAPRLAQCLGPDFGCQ
mmetsp:Transcript_42640/g.108348  ORF Transcript_42640/g.108348 Transcript_42640/m.108348 type:complete len:285 (+) Transcript_42640:935-1789(+)